MRSIDTDFSAARWNALNGDATAMVAMLRDTARHLDNDEREILATMIERLAEHARGDIGGDVGRPEMAAGHWQVRRALDRYDALLKAGRQKSEAKAIVADEQDLSVRTVDNYLRLRRDRAKEVDRLTAIYANK